MGGPETNTEALPSPIWGFAPPSPEPDTKKLDALLASLNGSAERFQTLWFSFLGLTLYLAIAALATTHRDLLLNNPQTLPILNIKVELLPFYVIAPLLYLVFHFYLLMMLQLLARTAAPFEAQLLATLPIEADRELYRARVENALFLQLLIGRKDERAGVNSLLLALIALITIVVAPLATLILMQLQFLPYHSFGITWWQRAAVFADLGIVFFMWRFFFYSGVENPVFLLRGRPRLRSRPVLIAILCVLIAATGWLSLWEGRWAGEPGIGRANLVATADGVVFGLFPDRLKLPSEPIVGEAKLEETKKEITSRGGDFVPTIKLDGRDLQAADLSGADLRGVSLNAAALQGANLTAARLDGTRLSCIPDPDDAVRQIPPGSIKCANLQGASISRAELQGANLRNAFLPGAYLYGAQLQGANLRQAQLQGGDLIGARLQGANVSEALLEGADLSRAWLEGANLILAQLQGANLEEVRLQGANLDSAKLQGADLSMAYLQGANLNRAQLQGADLRRASLADAEVKGAVVWRTDFADADLSTATIWFVRADQVKLNGFDNPEQLTQSDINAWIAAATQFAPEVFKTRIIQRFARLKPHFQTADQDARDDNRWKTLADSDKARDPTGVQHRRRLVAILGDLACGSFGAPYVARGLLPMPLDLGRLVALGDQLDPVRTRMEEARKTPEKCPGVAGFTEDDWRALEAIKPD